LDDIEGIARIAERKGIPFAVDNTFLTPLGQDVFSLGADVSLHSTTKWIEGHNATVGGAAVVREDEDLLNQLRHARKSAGLNQTPQEAWLTLQGVKTLPARLPAVSRTATGLAERLAEHPLVEDVLYPGLDGFAQRKLAERQHEHHGGILAFELPSYGPASRLGGELELIPLAENLGTTETLLTHPASMTHGSLSAEERERLGITEGLLRLSVGLEALEDLWADLEQGLAAVGGDAD
jgi:cystathionine beta-lyase/cystathionine gamma-synthase